MNKLSSQGKSFSFGAVIVLSVLGLLGLTTLSSSRPPAAFSGQEFDPQNPPANTVVFFEDTNYQGRWFASPYDRDYSDLRGIYLGENQSSGNWNDRVSSLKIGKDACVTLWKDINFKGDKSALQGNQNSTNCISSLVPSGWNDKLSSFKVRMRNNCAQK
jgi:Beta/Gamma crystallin